ncbi:MAG TPA: glycosyltransferase [Solirubrobacteraceae bacterium]|nr:glycosyltransferase [Solirubrobacteraceae bacterium]
MRRQRVAVIGSLASCDLGLGEALLRRGLDVTVLRHVIEGSPRDLDPEIFPTLASRGVTTFGGQKHLMRILPRFAFVFSYTSALANHLGEFARVYPAAQAAGWPRWMNICTGSDMTELALEDSEAGRRQRRALRLAFVNVVPNYPWAIAAAIELRLRNTVVLPFPFRPIDVVPAPERVRREELVLFHPSNLDWGATDRRPGRTSTKGNDRFLRALARFVGETHRPVRLIALDRGPDRALARELVTELGLSEFVQWRGALSHAQLYEAIQDADVVVDQFDVGGMGGIAWESMALGTPVLTYLHPPSDRLSFDVPTPVLNAYTEEEILEKLRLLADPGALLEQRRRVAEWMTPRREGQLDRYLLYMALATGRHPSGGPPRPGPVGGENGRSRR